MKKYAVIGSPINHSLSPVIHRLFAEQTGLQLTYDAIEVKPDIFLDKINALADQGYTGLNITVPLKDLAWQAADKHNDMAERAKAVNTLTFEPDGQRSGFNTDGIGLIKDLTQNHKIELENKSILILGAGGAVRGILAPLLQKQPAAVTIANRNAEKAVGLAREFADLGDLSGCGLDHSESYHFDIIINGTSAGLNNTVPAIDARMLKPKGIVYDMMYGRQPTAFVNWGLQHNASVALDGLGMLVEQAAEAFKIWNGQAPATGTVLTHLREQFKSG